MSNIERKISTFLSKSEVDLTFELDEANELLKDLVVEFNISQEDIDLINEEVEAEYNNMLVEDGGNVMLGQNLLAHLPDDEDQEEAPSSEPKEGILQKIFDKLFVGKKYAFVKKLVKNMQQMEKDIGGAKNEGNLVKTLIKHYKIAEKIWMTRRDTFEKSVAKGFLEGLLKRVEQIRDMRKESSAIFAGSAANAASRDLIRLSENPPQDSDDYDEAFRGAETIVRSAGRR